MKKVPEKPPYASTTAIDELFRRMENLKAPPKADSEWARAQAFDPGIPASIPSMLRWLGVADDEFRPDQKLWSELRFPESRLKALPALLKTSYAAIFDRIEVEGADRALLRSTFAGAYGSGDTQRPVAAFLTLARHAGMKVGAEQPDRKPSPHKATPPARKPRQQVIPKAPLNRPRSDPNLKGSSRSSDMTISLAVEIPADWNEAQIADRILMVRRAMEKTTDSE
jgi:hypothetical protein